MLITVNSSPSLRSHLVRKHSSLPLYHAVMPVRMVTTSPCRPDEVCEQPTQEPELSVCSTPSPPSSQVNRYFLPPHFGRGSSPVVKTLTQTFCGASDCSCWWQVSVLWFGLLLMHLLQTSSISTLLCGGCCRFHFLLLFFSVVSFHSWTFNMSNVCLLSLINFLCYRKLELLLACSLGVLIQRELLDVTV